MSAINRYARQMVVPEVGPDGQKRLRAAHILVVGAGGLGVPVLQYLAGAGIGAITLVDPDLVEESNLHRQPIYGSYVGQPKVHAAADFLQKLNPEVMIHPVKAWITPANAPTLIQSADLVLDCADTYAASYTLSDYCFQMNKPLISSSVTRMSGYVGGFCGGSPSLRALFPDLPDDRGNCATMGVVGPVVGMFGALQAQMALGVLLGMEPSPLGQLMRFEMRGFRSYSLRFDNAPEPSATPHRFIAREHLTPNDFVVELRNEQEAPDLLVPFAHRMMIDDFGPNGPVPAEGQRAVFICRTGLRAWTAADRLRPHWSGEIALLADLRG